MLLAGSGRFGGVVGAFASLLTVEDGGADAIAAALGASAAAVAVSGIGEAAAILAALKTEDAGRADLVIAAGQPHGGNAARAGRAAAEMPPGVRRAVDLVKAPGEFALAVEELLAGVAVAFDLAEGLDLLRSHPQLQVVTLDGDLIGAHWARGGSAGAPSLIGMRAAAQDAAEALREARKQLPARRAEHTLTRPTRRTEPARSPPRHWPGCRRRMPRRRKSPVEARHAGRCRPGRIEATRRAGLAAGIATAERGENDQAGGRAGSPPVRCRGGRGRCRGGRVRSRADHAARHAPSGTGSPSLR